MKLNILSLVLCLAMATSCSQGSDDHPTQSSPKAKEQSEQPTPTAAAVLTMDQNERPIQSALAMRMAGQIALYVFTDSEVTCDFKAQTKVPTNYFTLSFADEVKNYGTLNQMQMGMSRIGGGFIYSQTNMSLLDTLELNVLEINTEKLTLLLKGASSNGSEKIEGQIVATICK